MDINVAISKIGCFPSKKITSEIKSKSVHSFCLTYDFQRQNIGISFQGPVVQSIVSVISR